jgi:hypothetical protein
MTDSTTIKEFNWNSEQAAKSEFPEWSSLFTRNLSLKGIVYTLTETHTNIYRPLSPGPEPVNAADRREWVKLAATYATELRKFHSAFDQAIGVLRASFKYGSKASADVEAALLNPPQGIQAEDWTPEVRFRTAFSMLTHRYCPRDSTDVSTLRRSIQELTDINSGGFHAYASEFTKLHLQLRTANAEPTPTELTEWVKKGIENQEVRRHLAATILRGPVQPTFEEIFTEVRTFLKNMGDDCDPYRTSKSGPTSKPLVAARIDIEPIKCTRCWRQGHLWKKCTAKTCFACGKLIEGEKFCSNYANHTVPGTNWAPKHLLKPSASSPAKASSVPVTPQPHIQAVTPSPTGSVADEIKRTRKALSALLKQSKKQKTDG